MKPSFVHMFYYALDSLSVPGVAERWAAVQAQIHPCLAKLADYVQVAMAQHNPGRWALYEVSFKSQRYINRGRGMRVPIDEYHVAFDRPPRGSGILISASGAERSVLVGLQLWGVRKKDVRQLWKGSQSIRSIWLPLVEHIEREGEARFARTKAKPGDAPATWLDAYLANRNASYLWAGFSYPWGSLPTNLDEVLVAHVQELFPLNEALMEEAETMRNETVLREPSAIYMLPFASPPIETIVERIQSQGFVFRETIIRSYHVALQTRPLVILAGISGTGKTRLTRLYADAMHGIPSAARENPYYLLVAAQPDWHNARDLLGYYNALTGLYQPTPFLRFLLRAAADPQQPHYVCLDEMNLARPEYYLAPLLSALETTEHTIDLGIPSEEALTVTGETVSNPFRLPLNVAITGTINVDESTHALSDKLLDRANVIELTDVDLEAFRAQYAGHVDDSMWGCLAHVHGLVAQAGRPFGYRVLREIVSYIEHAEGIMTAQQALDLQVKQKVLPKLRGEDSPPLRKALEDLRTLLEGHGLAESSAKVHAMLERLRNEGFTDFY